MAGYISYEYSDFKRYNWEIASHFCGIWLTWPLCDNATCSINSDFDKFMTNNGMKHITPALFNLVMNSQAKWAVKSFKDSLKKIKEGDIET